MHQMTCMPYLIGTLLVSINNTYFKNEETKK